MPSSRGPSLRLPLLRVMQSRRGESGWANCQHFLAFPSPPSSSAFLSSSQFRPVRALCSLHCLESSPPPLSSHSDFETLSDLPPPPRPTQTRPRPASFPPWSTSPPPFPTLPDHLPKRREKKPWMKLTTLDEASSCCAGRWRGPLGVAPGVMQESESCDTLPTRGRSDPVGCIQTACRVYFFFFSFPFFFILCPTRPPWNHFHVCLFDFAPCSLCSRFLNTRWTIKLDSLSRLVFRSLIVILA